MTVSTPIPQWLAPIIRVARRPARGALVAVCTWGVLAALAAVNGCRHDATAPNTAVISRIRLATVPSQTPTCSAGPCTFAYSAVAVDSAGAPAKDAVIRFWVDSSVVASGRTDASGAVSYSFSYTARADNGYHATLSMCGNGVAPLVPGYDPLTQQPRATPAACYEYDLGGYH